MSLLAGAVALLAACGSDPGTLVGYEVEPAPDVAGFALTDVAHDDEPVELRARPGEILVPMRARRRWPRSAPLSTSSVIEPNGSSSR